MKKTKAYQRLPFRIGLNKDIAKNIAVFFLCYSSALDARLENPKKLIVACHDFVNDTPMYIPMTVSQFINCRIFRFSDDLNSRLCFSYDFERLQKGI